jgi:hypothetical protein
MGAQTHTLEDAAYARFKCEYYTAIRRPLQAAATAPSKSGLAGAIRWAAADCMPQGALRAAHPETSPPARSNLTYTHKLVW